MEVDEVLADVSVSEVSGEPFPEVSVEAGVASIRNLLRAYPAVLVKISDKDDEAVVGRYVGILTRADLRETDEV
jgi:predicted transcriptional regulator